MCGWLCGFCIQNSLSLWLAIWWSQWDQRCTWQSDANIRSYKLLIFFNVKVGGHIVRELHKMAESTVSSQTVVSLSRWLKASRVGKQLWVTHPQEWGFHQVQKALLYLSPGRFQSLGPTHAWLFWDRSSLFCIMAALYSTEGHLCCFQYVITITAAMNNLVLCFSKT